jgi:hypothetical protein
MPKYYPTNRKLNIQTALAHIQNLCAKAGSHKMKKQKTQTIQPRYLQCRQQRAMAQQIPADSNDLIEGDKEEGHQRTNSKQRHKDTYQNPPSSLPSTIKVMKASNRHETSSVSGLSSIMDMNMMEISEENQVLMVKGCIKKHVFSIWKFYQKDFLSHFSEDDKTM